MFRKVNQKIPCNDKLPFNTRPRKDKEWQLIIESKDLVIHKSDSISNFFHLESIVATESVYRRLCRMKKYLKVLGSSGD